jgi:hypothetical protein
MELKNLEIFGLDGYTDYAGRAHAVRPYQRKTWMVRCPMGTMLPCFFLLPMFLTTIPEISIGSF